MEIVAVELLRSQGSSLERVKFARSSQSKGAGAGTFTCLELAEKGGGNHDILYAGRSDGQIVFWRLQERNLYGGSSEKERKDETMVSSNRHKGSVTCLFYSQKLLISCSADNTIKIWDQSVFGEHCVQTLHGHTGTVTAVVEAVTHVLISCSIDCTVKVWRPQAGREMLIHPFFECTRTVDMEGAWATTSGIYGLEEWTCYIGDSEGHITLFNQARSGTRREKEVRPWKKWMHIHTLGISQLKIIVDQNFLLSVSFDCTCRVMDALSGQLFVTVGGNFRHLRYTGVAWDKSNEVLLVCNAEGSVEVWNTYTETRLIKKEIVALNAENPEGVCSGLSGIVGAGNGHFFAISPDEDVIYRNMVVMNTEFQEFQGHTDSIISLVLPPACTNLHSSDLDIDEQEVVTEDYVISCSIDNTIRCWDGSDSEMFSVIQRFCFTQQNGEFSCMISIPELNSLATGNDNGSIAFWDAYSGASASVKIHGNTVSCLCYIKTARVGVLVSTSYDGSIGSWTLFKSKNGLVNPRLENKVQNAHGVAEPEIIALTALQHIAGFITSGNDYKVKLWRLGEVTPYSTIEDLEDVINCLVIDGYFLFGGSHLGSIHIWNISLADESEVTELFSFRAHAAPIRSLNLVSHYGYLISCGTDGFIRVWDYTDINISGAISVSENCDIEIASMQTQSENKLSAKLLKEIHRADKDIKSIACQVGTNRSTLSIIAGCQDGAVLRIRIPLDLKGVSTQTETKTSDQSNAPIEDILSGTSSHDLKSLAARIIVQNKGRSYMQK